METQTRRRHWTVSLTAMLALSALTWWFASRSEAPSAPPDHELVERAPEVLAATATRLPAHKQLAHIDFSPDGVPIRPAGSDEVNAVGMLPHPITPEHQRIFRENNLIGALNGAMDIKDVAGLRTQLRQYREEYPEDAHVLQDGYELIANCLERPGPETRATAQRYYDEERDSGLRRYIRRHCLEAPTP